MSSVPPDSDHDPNSADGAPPNPYGAAPNPYGAPPENPYANTYGTPPNPYGASAYQQGPGYVPPVAAPLPLGEAIKQLPSQYIKILTKPSAMTFAEEMGKASWDIIWIQLLFLAIITAIFGYVASLITTVNIPSTTSGTASPISAATIRAIISGASLSYIILIPIGFFIGMGIMYGLAKLFGGQGRFVTQGYAFLLYEVPLGIVMSMIGLIPLAGSFIALAISVYELVLSIFVIMAVHRLSGGKATAVILIPAAVGLLLVCAAVIIIIVIIVNAAQHIH